MTVLYEHLVGRPFVWGVTDCFTLFRDFYFDNFGIVIRDYARPNDWSSDKLDLMRLCYQREGFDMMTDWKPKDLRPGDVLCVTIGESNPNHFAIYAGDNMIVHHLYGRISSADIFRDFWRNMTGYVLRHPDAPDLSPVYPDTTIGELLRARHHVQAADPAPAG
jgi:cell wall-associated NlpC family hydrolase